LAEKKKTLASSTKSGKGGARLKNQKKGQVNLGNNCEGNPLPRATEKKGNRCKLAAEEEREKKTNVRKANKNRTTPCLYCCK